MMRLENDVRVNFYNESQNHKTLHHKVNNNMRAHRIAKTL